MPRSSSVISSNVYSRAKGLDQYLKKIERLRTAHQLSNTDAERAYTGGFLEFHAFIERQIERLFVGLLLGALRSSDPTVRARINVLSYAVAYNVIKGERTYVDWLPYERYTLRRAKAFFTGGRPFDRLDGNDIQILKGNAIIRNALAHQSATSLRQFKKRFVNNRNLPPSQHRPSGYLRGIHTIGQTRMNFHLAQTALVIAKLSD